MEPSQNHVDGIPSEEDFLPAPRKPPGPFQLWPEMKYASSAFILAGACLVASWFYWNEVSDLFSASGERVWGRGEYWRLFLSLFAHGDLSHLGSNLLPLLFFGWMLRSYFGILAFPVVPLLFGVASMAATIAVYPPDTSVIGASGMIYGMIAQWLVLYIRFDRDNPFAAKCLRVAGFVVMMLFPNAWDPKVSHMAHASGFALGLLAGGILLPFVSLRAPPVPPSMLRDRPRRTPYSRYYPRIRKTYVEPEEAAGEAKAGEERVGSADLSDETSS